ncbi:MAG: hypothetical protein IT372_37125 [Polyangiaceae bacterium]|nr:hypothetical protein [Polyangiaceae bacterium]
MPPATTLTDAYDVLDPLPIDFKTQADFYVEPPPRTHDDGVPSPHPMDRIRRALRTTFPAKVFLAGHVGAGKSTQLQRLATDPEILKHFSVVLVRLETVELPFLDAPQLLFHMARGLYEHGRSLGALGDEQAFRAHVVTMSRHLYGEQGLSPEAGTTSLEVDLWLVKLRQDLKVSEKVRKHFREFGETHRTLLQDLLRDLSATVELSLQTAGKASTLLMIIDDLDKVRTPEQQKDLFQTNLGALLSPRFRVIYTLPAAVSFDPARRELHHGVEHIYPERVLDKAKSKFDPVSVILDDAVPFFRDVLHRRVDPALVEEEAVRIAVAYSGGVVRDYFRLLKEAAAIAEQRGEDRVGAAILKSAVREERLRWTRTLDHEDYLALLSVHRTHDRRDDERHRRLLDLGLLLECYNDDTWYEAHPLLWASLERRARDDDG